MVDFEHSIFILLLLSTVLNAKPPRPRWGIFGVVTGVLLAFLPPSQPLPLPWELILGGVLPLLLWQNIRRIINAKWRGWKSIVLWCLSVLILGTALKLAGSLSWTGALLFGLVASSMLWRANETEDCSSYISQAGPLTLVFLLLETEAMLVSPNQYLGSIFSGAFFGISAALAGLYLIRRTPPQWHTLIGLGQVYLAYWLTYIAGASAVTASLLAVMVFMWLNQFYKLGFHEGAPPAPLNTWPGFISILLLFLVLGWQSHQPVSRTLILEVAAGMAAALGIIGIGRQLDNPAFPKQKAVSLVGLRVAVLLFPALMLWPREVLKQPAQVAIAAGVSIFVIGLARFGLSYFLAEWNSAE